MCEPRGLLQKMEQTGFKRAGQCSAQKAQGVFSTVTFEPATKVFNCETAHDRG